jgi:hypothetical protein
MAATPLFVIPLQRRLKMHFHRQLADVAVICPKEEPSL